MLVMAPESETPKERMRRFLRSFPALKHAPGVEPFDPLKLDAWAAGPCSHGERCTAQFVLNVWTHSSVTDEMWSCGPFDVLEALAVWDEPQRAAFLAWARDPWWP